MTEDSGGTIKMHVPDKGISEITMKNLQRYDDAAYLARTGIPIDPEFMPRNYNEKTKNRFEGLRLMLSCQQHIISGNNMATIEKNCFNTWKRKNKNEDIQKSNQFEDEDNDIKELKAILYFLNDCEEKIEKSIQTKSYNDDFYWEKEIHDGTIRVQLSPRFFEMHGLFIESYSAIFGILIDHKIVTFGQGDDADRTEEEKEQELRKRMLQG